MTLSAGAAGVVARRRAFSPDGKLLAAADVDVKRPQMRIWDVRTRRLTAYRSQTGAASLAFSPNGEKIAAAAETQGTEIRDVHTGRLITRLTGDDFSRSVAFSPDGKLVVVGQFDGKGLVFSTDTWRPVGRPLEAHTARINYPVFTPDGRTLATASADGTVLLWDLPTRKPIGGPLTFEPGTWTAAAFSPDGRYLYAISTTGDGIRFDTSPAAWERHACLVAGRELTLREWQDALPGRPYRRVCGAP